MAMLLRTFISTRSSWLAAVACLTASTCARAEPSDAPAIPVAPIRHPEPVDFEREVLPALRDNCLACHNRTRSKADLVLETPADIRKGGENGPAVVPGKASASLLFRVSAHLENPVMPPRENKASAADLTPPQLALIKLWIDQGAKGEVRGSAAAIPWQPLAPTIHAIYAVAVTADGHYAAAGRANRIDLYDLPANRFLATLADPSLGGVAHREMVESLAFSADGNWLASGGFAEVKLWRRSPPNKRFAVSTNAGEGVRRVAVSPDGTRIAIAAEGWPVEIVDGATGRALRSIDASTAAPVSVAFSPDGTQLMVASADRGVRVSSASDSRLIAQTAAPGAIAAAAWIADGKQIAFGGADAVLRVWQIEGGLREFKQPSPIAALSAAGQEIICGGAEGFVRRITAADGKLASQFTQGSPIAALAVRSDGKAIAVIGKDGSAKLWDAAKGIALADLKGDAPLMHRQANDERALVLATGDVAYARAVQTRVEAERKAAGDRLKASNIALAAAEKVSADKAAALLAAKSAKAAADAALTAVPSRIKEFTLAAQLSEKRLADARDRLDQADNDGETPAEQRAALRATFEERAKSLAAAKAAVQALTADPQPRQGVDAATAAVTKAQAEIPPADLARSNAQTEQQLATAADAKAVENLTVAQHAAAVAAREAALADAQQKKTALAVKSSGAVVRSAAFSADGATLVTVADDAAVHLWSGVTGQPLETLPLPDVPVAAAVGGDSVFAVRRDGIDCWSAAGQWSLSRVITSADGVLVDRVGALAFSPDSRRLATGSGEPTRSGKIALWDVASGQLVKDLKEPHSDSVLSLAFSRDGSALASGGADRLAKIIDLASGSVVRSIEGHTGHVLGVAWKADGRTLATSGADGQVKLWDTTTGDRKGAMGGFGKEVNAVAYLGVSDLLMEASADGQVRICNEAFQNPKNLVGAAELIHAAAVTPDGQVIVTGNDAGIMMVWRDIAAPPVSIFAPPR